MPKYVHGLLTDNPIPFPGGAVGETCYLNAGTESGFWIIPNEQHLEFRQLRTSTTPPPIRESLNVTFGGDNNNMITPAITYPKQLTLSMSILAEPQDNVGAFLYGMICFRVQTGLATNVGDVFSSTLPFADNNYIMFGNGASTTFSKERCYRIVLASGGLFKVSDTVGGSAIVPNTDESNFTVYKLTIISPEIDCRYVGNDYVPSVVTASTTAQPGEKFIFCYRSRPSNDVSALQVTGISYTVH